LAAPNVKRLERSNPKKFLKSDALSSLAWASSKSKSLSGRLANYHDAALLNISCRNNAGLKTQACQSLNGRVLSLNRQENIGPHPAP
jgi:hypothetical protein